MRETEAHTCGSYLRNRGPLLHMFRTLPGMLFELFLVPAHVIRQERDWKRLLPRIPSLKYFPSKRKVIEASLRGPYQDYVSNYSSPLISLSLNRAAFLNYLTRATNAGHILDLGSGFSSYVFRRARADTSAGNVISVDDSEQWLEETRSFLRHYHLEDAHLYALDQMSDPGGQFTPGRFDLCLIDIGDFALRAKLLPTLLEAVRGGSIVLIDDFHVTRYRKHIIAQCAVTNVDVFSLRKVTRRRLSHMAIIMQKAAEDS